MNTRLRFLVAWVFLITFLTSVGVQAQTDAALSISIISGNVEISIDDGATYGEVANGTLLEPGNRVRWSSDAIGSLLGPDNVQIFFSGPELGAGELQFEAVDDPDTTTGLRLQQIEGDIAYAHEADRAELEAFMALEEDEQLNQCLARQASYETFVPDPVSVAAEVAAPLEDAAVKVVDSSDTSYGLLASGWLFLSVGDDGEFNSSSWTMDANFEANVAGLLLRRDTAQPDYTIVDRYCQDVVMAEDTVAAGKFTAVVAKPVTVQQDLLPFVLPEPGTTIEYTVDPDTGALTITMSPGGQASFLVPEGGLPAGVTIQVDGFVIELDTTQAGALTLASGGDGEISATGAGGGAIITSPQGVVLTLNSTDPNVPAQAAITDTGTGPVAVQPLAGSVGLQTNGVATTVALPDGSTTAIPAGESYELAVAVQPNGETQVIQAPNNPAPIVIVPPSPTPVPNQPAPVATPQPTAAPPPTAAPTTAPPAPTAVDDDDDEEDDDECPPGQQPSGVGGPCVPSP